MSDPPAVDTIILDGAAVVHLLDPRTAQTFSDYTDTVTMAYFDRQLQLRKTQHVDLVSRDTYIHDSIASSTRKRRGKRIRRRVLGKTDVPNNWKGFLRRVLGKTDVPNNWKGFLRRVLGKTDIPNNWKGFLRVPNK